MYGGLLIIISNKSSERTPVDFLSSFVVIVVVKTSLCLKFKFKVMSEEEAEATEAEEEGLSKLASSKKRLRRETSFRAWGSLS